MCIAVKKLFTHTSSGKVSVLFRDSDRALRGAFLGKVTSTDIESSADSSFATCFKATSSSSKAIPSHWPRN